MKIKAVECMQNGQRLYVGVARAGELLAMIQTDICGPDNKDGYQRAVAQNRARNFGRYIANPKAKGISPNSVLLNVRQDGLEYKAGTLTIMPDTTLWVVDGQHRLEGLRVMMVDNEDLGKFELPIVILTLPDPNEEAKQFLIINKTQKGVKSDLAERIQYRISTKEGALNISQQYLEGVLPNVFKDIEWKSKTVEIVDQLNKRTDCVWLGKIGYPNEPSKLTPVSQNAFTGSLGPIFKDALYGKIDTSILLNLLINYWNALKETWPEAFAEPSEYIIQKRPGVYALHNLLPFILNYCYDPTDSKRVWKKEKLAHVLGRFLSAGINSEAWANNSTFGFQGASNKGINYIVQTLTAKLKEQLEGADQNIEV